MVVAAPLSTVSRQAEALSLCLQEHPSDVLEVSQHAGSTWQVADVRRPLMSAAHVVQAGNTLHLDADNSRLVRYRGEVPLRRAGNV